MVGGLVSVPWWRRRQRVRQARAFDPTAMWLFLNGPLLAWIGVGVMVLLGPSQLEAAKGREAAFALKGLEVDCAESGTVKLRNPTPRPLAFSLWAIGHAQSNPIQVDPIRLAQWERPVELRLSPGQTHDQATEVPRLEYARSTIHLELSPAEHPTARVFLRCE